MTTTGGEEKKKKRKSLRLEPEKAFSSFVRSFVRDFSSETDSSLASARFVSASAERRRRRRKRGKKSVAHLSPVRTDRPTEKKRRGRDSLRSPERDYKKKSVGSRIGRRSRASLSVEIRSFVRSVDGSFSRSRTLTRRSGTHRGKRPPSAGGVQ